MLTEATHSGATYNLVGEAITQQQLAHFLNITFGTNLTYDAMSIEAYKAERTAELGQFLGTIIGGIYESIRLGFFQVDSDFAHAAGREHISWEAYFSGIKTGNNS